ncbi:uncharacterized protein LOC113794972 [Dermatophagoides pteronyssinus]|uniref:uncharacterized protein LOC113794972 n=1 Tax=Dermatophagoides pteronyssinus TaxID=6956 RepID=UPI003F666B19
MTKNYHHSLQFLLLIAAAIIIPIECEIESIKESSSSFEFTVLPPKHSDILIKNGRKEYETLLEKRNIPVYGKCWELAIERLEENCNQMNELRQSWLSISFTSCFLQNMGSKLNIDSCQQVIRWNDNDNIGHIKPEFSSNRDKIKECTRNMIDSNLFNTYTMFFIHTQSICFYLQSEKWQKNTEKLVNNLVHDAHIVSNELTTAVGQIQNLEQLQHSSLEAQITINHELNQAKMNLEQFQRQTRKQQDLIEKIITQFTVLQDFLITEFSTSSTIFFYIITMLVIYFITTPKRTIDIRSWLYMIMIVCFFFEKKGLEYLCWWLNLIPSNLSSSTNIFDSIIQMQWDMNQKIWLLRKSMLFTQAFIFIWRFLTYKDMNEINNQILCTNASILRNIHQMLTIDNHKYTIPSRILSNESEYSTEDDDDNESSLSDYETDESFQPNDDDSFDLNQSKNSYNFRPNRPTIFIDNEDSNHRLFRSPERFVWKQEQNSRLYDK